MTLGYSYISKVKEDGPILSAMGKQVLTNQKHTDNSMRNQKISSDNESNLGEVCHMICPISMPTKQSTDQDAIQNIDTGGVNISHSRRLIGCAISLPNLSINSSHNIHEKETQIEAESVHETERRYSENRSIQDSDASSWSQIIDEDSNLEDINVRCGSICSASPPDNNNSDIETDPSSGLMTRPKSEEVKAQTSPISNLKDGDVAMLKLSDRSTSGLCQSSEIDEDRRSIDLTLQTNDGTDEDSPCDKIDTDPFLIENNTQILSRNTRHPSGVILAAEVDDTVVLYLIVDRNIIDPQWQSPRMRSIHRESPDYILQDQLALTPTHRFKTTFSLLDRTKQLTSSFGSTSNSQDGSTSSSNELIESTDTCNESLRQSNNIDGNQATRSLPVKSDDSNYDEQEMESSHRSRYGESAVNGNFP